VFEYLFKDRKRLLGLLKVEIGGARGEQSIIGDLPKRRRLRAA